MRTSRRPRIENFATRLAALAKGASEAARVCRAADAAGFEWPPARKADSEPPYELRPGTGRRGPQELWQRFDQAITRLGTMAAGEDMLEVARAYEELATIVGQLAEAVKAEDRASGTRPRARAPPNSSPLSQARPASGNRPALGRMRQQDTGRRGLSQLVVGVA